jgi:hypothetical protein
MRALFIFLGFVFIDIAAGVLMVNNVINYLDFLVVTLIIMVITIFSVLTYGRTNTNQKTPLLKPT